MTPSLQQFAAYFTTNDGIVWGTVFALVLLLVVVGYLYAPTLRIADKSLARVDAENEALRMRALDATLRDGRPAQGLHLVRTSFQGHGADSSRRVS